MYICTYIYSIIKVHYELGYHNMLGQMKHIDLESLWVYTYIYIYPTTKVHHDHLGYHNPHHHL